MNRMSQVKIYFLPFVLEEIKQCISKWLKLWNTIKYSPQRLIQSLWSQILCLVTCFECLEEPVLLFREWLGMNALAGDLSRPLITDWLLLRGGGHTWGSIGAMWWGKRCMEWQDLQGRICLIAQYTALQRSMNSVTTSNMQSCIAVWWWTDHEDVGKN